MMATEQYIGTITKMNKEYIEWSEFFVLLELVEAQIKPDDIVYGIPKGGMIVSNFLRCDCKKTYDPNLATIILDDIVDSGRTKQKHIEQYPNAKFVTLIDKQQNKEYAGYLVFPWEVQEDDAEMIITKMLEHIGENPTREGLLDTPKRVVKSWKTLFGGYSQKPEEVLSTCFSVDYDEMVICKDIEFYSTCEHHMLPFFGKCSIAYIPKSKVVGLSKLARLLEVFARRLQIQERLTSQIADAMMEHLEPLGCAVIVEAKHFCMVCRGVNKQNSAMVTSAIRGIFQNGDVKAEFNRLLK